MKFNFMYFVFYRDLRDDAKGASHMYVEPLELYDEVLRCNPEAFEYSAAGKHSTWFLP
jgi:cohesin loading factor subunit SCC2